MKYASIFLFSISLAYGGQHKLILKFDTPVNIDYVLNGYQVSKVKQLGDDNVYRVNIHSEESREDLLDDLYNRAEVSGVEENQTTRINVTDSAVDLDTRAMFIIDTRAMFIIDDQQVMDETQINDIHTRAMFIIDGKDDNALAMHAQYHIYNTRSHYAWDYATGRGVTVAVLDTGIDTKHEFLVNNIVPGIDYVGKDHDPNEEQFGLDSDGDGLYDEGFGHGTHVAGLVKTVAPGVSLMPVRVVDADGQAELFDIVQGIRFAIENGADIINMSMSIDDPSQLLLEYIAEARAAGIVVVTSAGNENSTNLKFPANVPSVLTVTSVGPDFVKSPFANYSNQVDVSAPGEALISTHPGNRYVARSGTSMSAPIVAGEAAIIFELVPDASVSYVRHRIKRKSLNIDCFNHDYKKKLGKGHADTWNAITVQNL
ncbi:MAG: S8 family serine peptidase [Acidobacteriota bacterium]|nr:S8 family serine peptidase [Acidobacteriota bacterium]